MGRVIGLIYGVICYAVFFLSFLYLIGFLTNFLVPKGIDSGDPATFAAALLINLGLIALFGAQHSVMARPTFKAWWTRYVPRSVERSTYVLLASLILFLMYWLWQPMPQVAWHIDNYWLRIAVWVLFIAGLGLVLLSTFVIDHFDLFGLKQVWLNFRQKEYAHPRFQVRFFYKFVRHPLYTGFLVIFWATPDMTYGHLLMAVGMTAYILIAVAYEERDLTRILGDDYASYRERVPMLFPRGKKAHETVQPGRAPSGMR